MALTMDSIAIGNAILTVENEEQALVRADPAQKDKGGEAAGCGDEDAGVAAEVCLSQSPLSQIPLTKIP